MRANAIARLASLGLVLSGELFGQSSTPIPEPTFVTGASRCPDPLDVAHEVIRLTDPEQRRIYDSGVRVEVDDLGERYRVRVSAPGLLQSKTYADPHRDCARRTTFAAVLVLVTLMPPRMAEEPERAEGLEAVSSDSNLGPSGTTSAPKPSTAPEADDPLRNASKAGGLETDASSASAPNPSESAMRVGLGLTTTWSPPVTESLSTTYWGVSMHTSLGTRRLRPFVAVTYATNTSFELTGIGGELRRWPVAAGLEWHTTPGGLDVTLGIGAVAVLERVRGRSLLQAQSQSAVELGTRLGATVALRRPTVTPWLGLDADWFPAPNEITSAPRGKHGTMPLLEVRSTLGLRINL